MSRKINGHGHVLPEPGQIPGFMKDKKVFWIDDDRKFMRQGNWSRPVTDPSFFVVEKLRWMEENDIEHEVVLNLSQLYCNGMERDLAGDVIRFQNDFNAELQHKYPEKFTTGFVVQAAWMDQALNEIERCVEKLGMTLLCLPTHFLDEQGNWHSIAHEKAYPIFEMASRLGLAIEIHPYDGPRIVNLEDRYWRFHLVWLCALTADTYHMYTLLGLPDRFPGMRTCFAHGNQFAQVNVGRRRQGFLGRPDLFIGAEHPDKYVGHESVFFDTIVHDIISFQALVKRQGAAQIVAGLDDPYPLGEMATVPGSYPGKVLDEAYGEGIINLREFHNIWQANVERWIGKKLI